MFKLVVPSDYFWPVKISYPVDNGKHESQTIDIKYKRLPQSEVDQALKDIREGNLTSLDASRKLISGWREVKDANGLDVDFNEDSLTKLLEMPEVAYAIWSQYFDSIREAKLKN